MPASHSAEPNLPRKDPGLYVMLATEAQRRGWGVKVTNRSPVPVRLEIEQTENGRKMRRHFVRTDAASPVSPVGDARGADASRFVQLGPHAEFRGWGVLVRNCEDFEILLEIEQTSVGRRLRRYGRIDAEGEKRLE